MRLDKLYISDMLFVKRKINFLVSAIEWRGFRRQFSMNGGSGWNNNARLLIF